EAAGRAGGVSSVPAFLAAHLKRRLAQKSPSTKGEEKGKKASDKKLSDKDLQETASSYVNLISDGAYTLESLEEQYASEWHPDNWAKIRSIVISQLEEKGS
ncbi:MAG TPA: hypothetical protein VE732_02775, partial [Nitrososphaera sp.]|nr:hypothetical protein [Nitrososphaera sp.]